MIGWTFLALLTRVHGGHMLDLLRAGGTSASEYRRCMLQVRDTEQFQIHKSEIGYMSWAPSETRPAATKTCV